MICRWNCSANGVKLVAGGPIAVAVEDFAQHAGRLQAGHPGQVDGASVWPARRSTPPSLATSGNRWPGRTKSTAGWRVDDRPDRLGPLLGRDAGAARPMIDRHGEGVWSGAVLFSTIGCRLSRSATSGRIGMQSCPRPWVIMKLTISGVTFSAAADEIALVFAVLGVHDDDNLARPRECANRVVDPGDFVVHDRFLASQTNGESRDPRGLAVQLRQSPNLVLYSNWPRQGITAGSGRPILHCQAEPARHCGSKLNRWSPARTFTAIAAGLQCGALP